MASSIAMRRVALANGSAWRRPLGSSSSSAVYSVTRSFGTSCETTKFDNDCRAHRSPVSRSRDPLPHAAFYDVYDQLSTTRRGWDVQRAEDALRMKVDMPGLGKEDVTVQVKDNTVIIKGEKPRSEADAAAAAERECEGDDGDGRRRYEGKINLTPFMYQINGIKVHMNNGVLKLTVPKLQHDHDHVVQLAVRNSSCDCDCN